MGEPFEILDAKSFLAMHDEIIDRAIYTFRPDNDRPYIIDVGANVGVGVVQFKEQYPGARIVAFEADRDAFTLLERNVQQRGYADVTLVRGALSDTDGIAPVMAARSNARTLSAVGDTPSATVPTVRLRPYLDRRVDLLKLTIAGAASAALADCADLLERVDRIVIDYHSLAGEAQTLHALTSVLANAGYRIYVRSADDSFAEQPFVELAGDVDMDLRLCVYGYRNGRVASRAPASIPPGTVRFGDLRRLTPLSTDWGFDRGTPVDRYYIERFLQAHAADVRGRVLEIGNDSYTRRFGGNRVTSCDVLHVRDGAPGATIIADLTDANHIPSNAFDCIVLTQTLDLIYDVRAALRTIHRILQPGGVVLATLPGISPKDGGEWADSWYWGFTLPSTTRLFAEIFEDVAIAAHGNVLAATCFLQGLAWQELTSEELDYRDATYDVVITARAVKRSA